jgi:hypothetical protein
MLFPEAALVAPPTIKRRASQCLQSPATPNTQIICPVPRRRAFQCLRGSYSVRQIEARPAMADCNLLHTMVVICAAPLSPHAFHQHFYSLKCSRTCPFVTTECTSETSPDCVSACKILHGCTSPNYVRVRTRIRLSGTERGEAVHKLPCRIRELRR